MNSLKNWGIRKIEICKIQLRLKKKVQIIGELEIHGIQKIGGQLYVTNS